MATAADFLKEYNEGLEAQTAQMGAKLVTFEVVDTRIVTPGLQGGAKSDFIRNKGNDNYKMDDDQLFFEIDLKILDGDKAGEIITQFDFMQLNDDGVPYSPIKKGAQVGDKYYPNSTTYDILDAGRKMGDDRFGKGFKKEVFQGLKFQMNANYGTSKKGNEYFILETDYNKHKNSQPRQSAAPAELMGEDIASATINPSDLPWE